MDYTVVDPDDLPATPEYPCDRRSITDATGLAGIAVARYRLAPGEELAQSYHYHEEREEVFVVTAGSLHVETPETEYVTAAGEVFVAGPESPIRPYNPAEAGQETEVFGMGAPRHDPGRQYDPIDCA